MTIFDTNLAIHECPTCGVRHGIPHALEKSALNDRGQRGQRIYCPNGHTWYFSGQTEAEKLRLERNRLKQRLAEKDDRIAQEIKWREESERTAAAYKGVATKLKKRIKAGVCPCCNRHFGNLQAHIETKHPDFSEDVAPDLRTLREADNITQATVATLAGVRVDQVSLFERGKHIPPNAAERISDWMVRRVA